MSNKSQRNQRSSNVVSTRARYSASVLERVTTDYFLHARKSKKFQVRNNIQWWIGNQWDYQPNQHQSKPGVQETTGRRSAAHEIECP
jgi:hypothetical protein